MVYLVVSLNKTDVDFIMKSRNNHGSMFSPTITERIASQAQMVLINMLQHKECSGVSLAAIVTRVDSVPSDITVQF